MEPWLLTIITGLLVLVLVGMYWVGHRQSRTPLTLNDFATKTIDSIAVANTIVRGVEQLYRTGKVGKDLRQSIAYARLKEFFPHLSHDQLIILVEGAVQKMNENIDE